MHQNAFSRRTPPGPAGELQRSPRHSSRSQGEGKGKREDWEMEVKGERDKKGRDNGGEEYGMGRGWKGKRRSRGEYKRGNCLH